MKISELADRFEAAGDNLADGVSELELLDPGARAFGGDAPGRLGALGRELHGTWSAAMTSRGREVAAHAERLTDMAHAIRRAAGTYQQIEDDTHRRAPAGES